MKNRFTVPKVARYDDPDKPWFVWFRYDGKLYRHKKGINYIQNPRQREIEAKALAGALHKLLQSGWNPLLPEPVPAAQYNLARGLEFALEKKKSTIRHKTYQDYSCSVRFFDSAVLALPGYSSLSINEVRRSHLKGLLHHLQHDRKWSAKAYNKHLGHVRTLLNELIQWDIIEANPADKINLQYQEQTTANRAATPAERARIREHLLKRDPNFLRFILAIYHTGIRPVELLGLKNANVNMFSRTITVPAHLSKTKKERVVPINPHLFKELQAMKLEILPKHYFLFGSFRESGRGQDGKVKDFIPGPTPVKRDTATKRWNRLIKKELNLDISMYAMKHSGADAKRSAGIEMEAIQSLLGHSERKMTEIYTKGNQEIYMEQIRRLSPDF